ncbi:Mpo1 family 2-hydroxy fatty acid dioxygenase [Perlucidibaca aquatica]|uniref:Mpo1 family 2-hydroxy fatty acid dioxygenase n=1 Tax=Perlucidibaca aquatica TaxID=1852776 RepID=UPI000839F794|nr:Mpo1-like protein [Perlucidibaca aquatica]
MKTLVQHLAQYASYHRNPRNVITHIIGIPIIVISAAALLAKLALTVNGVTLSAAMALAAASIVFYLRLDIGLGLIMAALMTGSVVIGTQIAALPTQEWLLISVGSFVVGWIIQFIGHYFEGRKPAFVDDMSGLAIGPLFVTAEVLFLLGLRRELRDAMLQDQQP